MEHLPTTQVPGRIPGAFAGVRGNRYSCVLLMGIRVQTGTFYARCGAHGPSVTKRKVCPTVLAHSRSRETKFRPCIELQEAAKSLGSRVPAVRTSRRFERRKDSLPLIKSPLTIAEMPRSNTPRSENFAVVSANSRLPK